MSTQTSALQDCLADAIVTRRLLDGLFLHGHLIVQGNIVAAVIVAALAWNYYPVPLIGGWLVLFTVVIAVRCLHTRWYLGQIHSDFDRSAHWIYLYVTIFLTALCWTLAISMFNSNLPVDYIKIDGSIVRDITNDPTDLALVKTINELGHVYGKQTIAEFVETPEILNKIKELGIDYAQGYYVGMPGVDNQKPQLRAVK